MPPMRPAALLCAAFLAFAAPAMAQPAEAPRIGIRTGVHPGFTRIVFDWPQPVRYSVVQQGEAVEIRFDSPAALDGAPLSRPLRNLRTMERLADGVLLALRPGVQVRHLTVGTRVAVDLLDPAPPRAAAPAAPRPRRGCRGRGRRA
ncbi:hypothetical protein [Falsiroseomonas sp. CW058]|uniref:hypothetical protein n=1 Tax=Falsiroseomonas sp. CW058 TaxID=3388664 RepID=UPI003D31431F